MLVKDLVALCNLASKISNPNSLTNLYRSIQLGPNLMQVCSEFGNMEVAVENGTGLIENRLLDLKSLASVKTLPPHSVITFTENESDLEWKCGAAKGKWNYVIPDNNHKIP